MSEPFFIVGDLNMNIMLNENGFLEFIENFNLKNNVSQPARVAS